MFSLNLEPVFIGNAVYVFGDCLLLNSQWITTTLGCRNCWGIDNHWLGIRFRIWWRKLFDILRIRWCSNHDLLATPWCRSKIWHYCVFNAWFSARFFVIGWKTCLILCGSHIRCKRNFYRWLRLLHFLFWLILRLVTCLTPMWSCARLSVEIIFGGGMFRHQNDWVLDLTCR